jgi:hypothetical protein
VLLAPLSSQLRLKFVAPQELIASRHEVRPLKGMLVGGVPARALKFLRYDPFGFGLGAFAIEIARVMFSIPK